MHEHVGFGTQTPLPANAAKMRAHGYLPTAERRQIATHVLANVVHPAARALTATGESHQPRHVPRHVA
jgi:hypothetical protein